MKISINILELCLVGYWRSRVSCIMKIIIVRMNSQTCGKNETLIFAWSYNIISNTQAFIIHDIIITLGYHTKNIHTMQSFQTASHTLCFPITIMKRKLITKVSAPLAIDNSTLLSYKQIIFKETIPAILRL